MYMDFNRNQEEILLHREIINHRVAPSSENHPRMLLDRPRGFLRPRSASHPSENMPPLALVIKFSHSFYMESRIPP